MTSSPIGRAWSRFDGAGRLVGVDLARGLAVLGMLAAHLLDTERTLTPDPSTWITLVNGRSSILFAVLAGVSIALVTGGPRPLEPQRRPRAAARLALRGALLCVIGLLLVNWLQPGAGVDPVAAQQMLAEGSERASAIVSSSAEQPRGLDMLVSIVPSNIVSAAAENGTTRDVSGQAASSVRKVRPSRGWTSSAATSQSGTSTNRRWCRRGCGTVSASSSRTRSP